MNERHGAQPPADAEPRRRRFRITRAAAVDPAPVGVPFFLGLALMIGLVFVGFPEMGVPASYAGPTLAVGAAALFAALLVRALLPGYVDIGEDGFLVDGRPNRRFVRFADVEWMRRETESVGRTRKQEPKRFAAIGIKLRTNRKMQLVVGERTFGGDKKADAVYAALEAALAAYRERTAADPGVWMLERGGRAIPDWLNRLRSIGEGANAGPREAPLSHERLWKAIGDPTLMPGVRAGAALALVPHLDERGKERFRIAIESTSAPELRAAFESAQAGDEEALERAIEELEKSTAS